MSHQEHLDLINKILSKIKSTETIQDLFKKHDMDLELIQYIPICFSETLDVSARTEKGIIHLNSELLDDPESIEHYLAHEITHVLQQTCGDKPTTGAADDKSYLDNQYEQEGFQEQTKYLSETKGDEAAVSYINDVLDYHEIDGKKERDKRKKQLLQLAASHQHSLNFGPLNKTKEELDDEFEQALEKGPINPRLYERKEIGISGKNKENTLDALQNLLKELDSDKPKERPKLKERLVQLMLPEVD